MFLRLDDYIRLNLDLLHHWTRLSMFYSLQNNGCIFSNTYFENSFKISQLTSFCLCLITHLVLMECDIVLNSCIRASCKITALIK